MTTATDSIRHKTLNGFYPKQDAFQNFVLIWIDPNIEQSNTISRDMLGELQHIICNVKLFRQPDEAIDFLTDIDNMNIFMIVGGRFARVVPLIQDTPQLGPIYIFCKKASVYEKWAKNWTKINGVYTDISKICNSLGRSVIQFSQNTIAMTIINNTKLIANEYEYQLDPSFICSQICKNVITDLEDDGSSLANFIDYYRRFKNLNTDSIKQFEKEYKSDKAIWWFTSPMFPFSILNHAISTFNMETVINMSFFISDLHKNIKRLHQEQINKYPGKFLTVYRGQGFSSFKLQQLQKSEDKLISFNNFLTANEYRQQAIDQAKAAITKSHNIAVVFKISINLDVSSINCARISCSNYLRNRQEVLFTLETIFRVGDITKIDDTHDLYQINLTSIADDDKSLRILDNSIKQDKQYTSHLHYLVYLLIQKGQYNNAKRIYSKITTDEMESNQNELYFDNIGFLMKYENNLKEAVINYEKGLEIRQNAKFTDNKSMAICCFNIAEIYHKMKEYSKALSYFQREYAALEKCYAANHPNIATCYNNIGMMYDNMSQYSDAILYYKKGLDIQQEILPKNHPLLAICYNNIGLAYENMREYSYALIYFEQALVILEICNSNDHRDLANCYNNIGLVYNNMNKYSDALFYFRKALDIRQKSFPVNHPLLARSYSNIGIAYDNMREYVEALSYFTKALEVLLENFPLDYCRLAAAYNNIGLVHYKTKMYADALSYYEKGLESCQQVFPNDHPSLATSYVNIGTVYFITKEYSKALAHFQNTLQIWEKSLPHSNNSKIVQVKKFIEIINQNTSETRTKSK